MVRATPVIPAAADRSSGRTIAIVYDCLAGTSIWLMLNLASRTTIADVRFGMSGTQIRRIFEGRCVKTIVRTSPMRVANLDANSAEMPARRFAPKKMLPRTAGSVPNRK
jgi:hypothetical protein